MIKKSWFIVLMAVCAMMMTSCSDDDENEVDQVWKERNRVLFFDISANSAYKELKSEGNNGSIFYKVIKEGTGTQPIYYNSTVKVYYTGSRLSTNAESEEEFYDFNVVEYPDSDPMVTTPSSLVQGFATALQHMVVGDRWEVWMPYQLGYGTTGQQSNSGVVIIPPYSTLKFELEVVEIVQQ